MLKKTPDWLDRKRNQLSEKLGLLSQRIGWLVFLAYLTLALLLAAYLLDIHYDLGWYYDPPANVPPTPTPAWHARARARSSLRFASYLTEYALWLGFLFLLIRSGKVATWREQLRQASVKEGGSKWQQRRRAEVINAARRWADNSCKWLLLTVLITTAIYEVWDLLWEFVRYRTCISAPLPVL